MLDQMSEGTFVMVSYQAKPGRLDELVTVLREHSCLLRQLHLITDYPATIVRIENNQLLEIYEWESDTAAVRAQENPKIQKLLAQIRSLSVPTPSGQVTELKNGSGNAKRIRPKRTNRVAHFEIHADDTERCAKFYQRLFRWDVCQWSNQPYWKVITGDDGIAGIDGGIIPRRIPNGNVLNTVYVQNIDEILSDVPVYGGSILAGKVEVDGVGWLAYAQDTEGNVFGVLEAKKPSN